jgi:hypothetical protein
MEFGLLYHAEARILAAAIDSQNTHIRSVAEAAAGF